MNYLIKFDDDGRKTTTYPIDETMDADQKEMLISEGYIEISEEDWSYYVGNYGNGKNGTGYIRDAKTGTPVDAPAYVPTKEEQLAKLDAQYDSDKAELVQYFGEAALAGDTETQAELSAELADLNAAYDEARREIEEG